MKRYIEVEKLLELEEIEKLAEKVYIPLEDLKRMYNDIEETVHEEIAQCFMGSNKIYNRALTKIKIYDII